MIKSTDGPHLLRHFSLSCLDLQNKKHKHLVNHYIFFTHCTSKNKITLRRVVQHMAYFINSSCSCFFLVTTNKKQPKNIVNRIFPITHDTLIQLVASLIQNTLHFTQYKIKPYSQLRVSMMSLTKFFTSSPMCNPNTFSLSLIGC